MAEYIERVPKCEDCIHTEVCLAQYGTSLKRWVEIDGCKRYKSKADVVDVRHGEWIYHECVSSHDGAISGFSCSQCSAFVYEDIFDMDEFNKDFCGACGAKMDGKGEGANG